MERLRNKRRLKPTPLDELCDSLSAELRAAKDALADTQAKDWDRRIGWHDAIQHVLAQARIKQRQQR